MSKFAIVKIGSFQYKVSEGEEIQVAKILGTEGQTIDIDQVLLLADEKKITVGHPLIKGSQVKTKILKQFKGKKIRVAIYKAKSRYRRVKGFRPHLTTLKIEKITS